MLAAPIQKEVFALAERLDRAGYGQQSAMVSDAAGAFGVSPQTVWRWVREVRGRRRRTRADAGTAKVDLAVVREVARVKEGTRRGKRITSTQRALSVAIADGRISEAVSVGTLNRHFRQQALLRPGKTFERKIAKGPNAMHQYDVTGSKVLFVAGRAEDGDWLLEVRPMKYRRNQALEEKGLWACGLIDDYSRVLHVEYNVAAGESFMMAKDFLSRAWGGDPRCAVRGMPVELNCDFGPIHSSEMGKNLMASLGVAFTDRMPESPNVTGKMENRWSFLFRDFELVFNLQVGRVLTLRALNDELSSWLQSVNAKAHPDFPALTRIDCYGAGLDVESIRYMPEDVAAAVFSTKLRQIDGFSRIRYANSFYRVPDEWRTDGSVEVIETLEGRLVLRNARTGETADAPLARPTQWGEYRGHKDTPNQTLAKEAKGLTIVQSPFSDQPVVLNAKIGADAAVDSVVSRHETDRCYTNEDEALQAARARLGVDAFLRNMGLTEAVRELARAVNLEKRAFDEKLLALEESA